MKLKEEISRARSRVHIFGWCVIAGVFLEVYLVAQGTELWHKKFWPLLADILIFLGVWGETHFSGKASKSEDRQKQISDEKIAELTKSAAEARGRAALLEQLTAFRHVPKDISKLTEFLIGLNSRTPIHVQIDYQLSDTEALCYALEIANIFKSAQIEIASFGSNSHIGVSVLGLHIAGQQGIDLEAIFKSFQQYGIEFGVRTGLTHIRMADGANLGFFVGSKVPPNLMMLLDSVIPRESSI